VRETSSEELRTALDSLAGVSGLRGIVLDVRGNPGGLLEQGIAVSDLFLPPGAGIVETRGRTPQQTETYTAPQGDRYEGIPVVVMVDESHDRLHATAYLLSQGQMIRKLLEDRNRTEALEGFVLGPYRTFQISLKDLEDATGVDFGALKRADPLARSRSGREAIEQNVPVVMPLESVADLVL